jgi:hypothetical protein
MPFHISSKRHDVIVVAVPVGPLGLCASIERCRWVPGIAFFPAWVSLPLML